MRRRIFVLIAAALLGVVVAARAAERVELVDQDHDGRKETKIFYENGVKTRIEVDKNGDGKPDEFLWFKNGKRWKAQFDTDFDGKPDVWNYYDDEGNMVRAERDSNHDGKPDTYQLFLKGRNIVLRERDTNYDGKIDERALTQWDPSKHVSTFINGHMMNIPTPGYTILWREEDKNFDGKVDAYFERGKPDAAKEHIGKPMQTFPTLDRPGDHEAAASGKPMDPGQALVERQNERYGLTK